MHVVRIVLVCGVDIGFLYVGSGFCCIFDATVLVLVNCPCLHLAS